MRTNIVIDSELIEEAQKLTALLRLAVEHCPWHAERIRAAGLDLARDRAPVSLDELRRIPRMTKEDARANVERVRWPGVPGGASR